MPATYNELRIADELRMALVGRTGSGKSGTGNSILGEKVFVSKLGGASVTKFCSYQKHLRYGRETVIVDTPGLFDTAVSNEATSNEIKKFIGLTSPGPHAIVFVTHVGRFTDEELKTVQFFVNQFGVGIYKYLIILFTGGDTLENHNMSLEEYIETTPPKLKEIISLAGGRTIAFNNMERDPAKMEQQVKALFSLIDRTVEENGGGCYTNEMYQEAEAALRQDEEERRRKAEAEKKAEEERMQAEFEKKLLEERARIAKEYKESMERIQAQHLDELARAAAEKEAEMKRQAEVDRVKAECERKVKEEQERLDKEHKDKMEQIREEQRKEIEKEGWFCKAGKAIDKFINWLF